MHRIFRVASLVFLILAAGLTVSTARQANLDVAPFGQSLQDRDSIGVQWPDMRRVVRVEVLFAKDGSPLPKAEAMRVEYWHRVWDGAATRRYTEQNAGSTGWVADDDWFNGEWKTADTRVEIDLQNRHATFRFASSEEKEFPSLKRKGVTYRPTLKIRVFFAGLHPKVAEFHVPTDSILRDSQIALQFAGRKECNDPVAIYNGVLIAKTASNLAGNCVLNLKLSYALNSDDREADRTVVEVHSPSNPFSFAVDELERGDRIYVKPFNVLVTRSTDTIPIAQYRQILEESGAKSIYDRVKERPEQTLSNAWRDMPIKRPYYFILGLEGGRQRFRVYPDGDIWVNHPNFATKQPGKDNGHFLWPDGMVYRFGLPKIGFADRTLADGYLPIIVTRWLDGDVLYEEEAFADTLAGNLNLSSPVQSDDPVVALVRFRLTNTGFQPRTARLTFTTAAQANYKEDEKTLEVLRWREHGIYGTHQGREVLRFEIETGNKGHLSNIPEGVAFQTELAGNAEQTLTLKIPFITLTEEVDVRSLQSLEYDKERAAVAQYWASRVAVGAQIHTPEAWLNDFYQAHVTHLLINDEREVGADRYGARVGSAFYGVFGNESIMMISDLDRRGYFKEAERTLELFLHYQGSVRLPGNFMTQKGVLYGAGGMEEGEYNQHHGWILWGLAEHYWYTRDRAWMEHAAPHLLEASRWITNERKGTMKLDAAGKRVPEYGLIPAGSLEDVTDWWYWLSTNAFSWWGLSNAAAALKDSGHPEGAVLVKEAEDYRQDLLRAYREAATRSPVVRLRDGTYVPHFPSNVYTRGRAHGWLRETLEGAIMLPITRLLDPNSREAEWILKDFEDNRYISDRFGYSIPVFDQYWFSRGGFSMQPNLLHGPLPYFYRDQIEHFIRAYFNAFVSAYDPTVRMLCEHPLPELGTFLGDHFKSSDEAQSTYWLRLMFASEIDGTLHLGRGIPRYWLRDGERLALRNAATHFGALSYEIRSKAKEGKIEMSLDPPTRNAPNEILVRFRHPENKPIRRVIVNGTEWRDFDSEKEEIRLPGNPGTHVEIVANF